MSSFTRLIIFSVALLSLAAPAASQHADFARVRVQGGPVVEYPSHWKLADEATVQNRVHAGQAVADVAGVDVSGFQKRARVIIESQPGPPTAQIRASVVTPQEYTQAGLRTATAADLRALKAEFEAAFRKISSTGSVRLHQVSDPRVESIAGRLALVIPYTRSTESDPVLWQVEQVKIPFEDRSLSLTISYRTSDAAAMKPILQRVKKTLAF